MKRDPMVSFMWFMAAVVWLLMVVGFVLLILIGSGSEGMAFGCGIVAPFVTWCAWMMEVTDRGL